MREESIHPWGDNPPPPLQAHFEDVLRILERDREESIQIALYRLERSQRTTWTQNQRVAWRGKLGAERARNVVILREYQSRGLFPINDLSATRAIPIFVDRKNTACAVGYLMRRSGAEESVSAIVEANNLVYVPDVSDGPLVAWILTSGLTQEEAALIQPTYAQFGGYATAVQPDGRYIVATGVIDLLEPNCVFENSTDVWQTNLVRGICRLNPDGTFHDSTENLSPPPPPPLA